jgi:hypothetical protein
MRKIKTTNLKIEKNNGYIYHEYTLISPSGEKEIHSFYTNKIGQGLFYWDNSQNNYQQLIGTCDFSCGCFSKLRRIAQQKWNDRENELWLQI